MKPLYYLLGVAALLVLALLIFDHFRDRADAAWQERAEQAIDSAKAVLEAQSDERVRAALDSAAAARARADTVFVDVERRVTVIRERIDTLRVALPPDTIRDAIIDTLLVDNGRLLAAYEAQGAVVDTLNAVIATVRQDNAALTARVRSLVDVLEDRPQPRSAWLPRIIAGYGATLDRRDWSVSDGPTVAIGWTLKL